MPENDCSPAVESSNDWPIKKVFPGQQRLVGQVANIAGNATPKLAEIDSVGALRGEQLV